MRIFVTGATSVWLSDPTQTTWVQHYIGLVMGDGIAA
jgi:hypothetical protein